MHSFETYVAVIQSLKGGRKTGGKKSKEKLVDQGELVNQVNAILFEAFNGRIPRNKKNSGNSAYVVNDFLNKGKGKSSIYSAENSQFVYPIINTPNGQVVIPIVASPNAVNDFNAFIDTIVTKTQYANFANQIKQAFAQGAALKQRSMVKSPIPTFTLPTNVGYALSPANSPSRTINLNSGIPGQTYVQVGTLNRGF